jgi:hypothetical protein
MSSYAASHIKKCGALWNKVLFFLYVFVNERRNNKCFILILKIHALYVLLTEDIQILLRY